MREEGRRQETKDGYQVVAADRWAVGDCNFLVRPSRSRP
jgi:hypothetical protein